MDRPLKHGIVVCHPAETSFTMAITQRYAQAVHAHGHDVAIRDLYRIGFDPVLTEHERQGNPHPDVSAEWDLLGHIDVFVLAYPIWFGAPPAMLKGYIDRVFGAGRTRGEAGSGAGASILEGKHLVSLTVSGSLNSWLDEHGVLRSLRNVFDRYLADVFLLSETYHYHFDGVQPGMPDHDFRLHLATVDEAASEVLARIGHLWPAGPNAGKPPFGR